MKQLEAGIRELKSNLSAYLRQVKAGGSVLITEHGKPIGRIVPIAPSLESKLDALQQAGLIAWNGRKLGAIAPLGRVQGKRTVAELLLEDRE
ncbi:MAG: type II toxin-antitoxin system prevent-host-death family antitoxin [Caldilineae bacterium]|nr:MAG: type II toxin-antitoxin system prevent-host-death family antitoxin [Caldilineae bacterium]